MNTSPAPPLSDDDDARILAELDAFEAVATSMNDAAEAGRFDEAAALVRAAMPRFPRRAGRLTRWAACCAALGGRPDEALEELERGLARGLWWSAAALASPDLDAVRGSARFAAIAEEAERRHTAAEAGRGVEILCGSEASDGAPLLLALHMRGDDAAATLPRWRACTTFARIAAIGSTQLLGPSEGCWDDPEGTERDLLAARAQLPAGPVVLGGASQGGARAVQLALTERPFEARGFVSVVPAFGLPVTVGLDGLRSGLAAAVARGVRGAFVLGEEDYYLAEADEVAAALAAAGLAVRVIRVAGLGHAYPAPELLADALAFVLE